MSPYFSAVWFDERVRIAPVLAGRSTSHKPRKKGGGFLHGSPIGDSLSHICQINIFSDGISQGEKSVSSCFSSSCALSEQIVMKLHC